jgi:hypothetical protein
MIDVDRPYSLKMILKKIWAVSGAVTDVNVGSARIIFIKQSINTMIASKPFIMGGS